jgi:hypothetical protein
MEMRPCGIINHEILDDDLVWIVVEVGHGVGDDNGL